ncbi:MAG: hypothetical protein ACLP0J_09465 [Solirubrobacteraceae bacterium]|jgi:hypothetical protein
MAIEDATLCWCEDGHTWIDQGDGTVSPSWGYGGTHMPVENPRQCPEPRHSDDGLYWCERCQEGRRMMGDCVRGCSLTPWIKPAEQWCGMPAPDCLKHAIGANRWVDQYLPFDGRRWCAWWVRQDGGSWRLTFHQGHAGRLWAAVYDCLDVRSGERVQVDRGWQARRAKLSDYPAHLRERWWRTPNGTLIGTWSTTEPGGAGWLLDPRKVERWVQAAVRHGIADTEGPAEQLALFAEV